MTGFRFGEATHRGMLGGVRLGQLLLGAGGAVWAIIWIDLSPSGAGAAAGLIGLAITIATATVPVSGRTVEQWLPVAGGWLTARLTGRTKTVSPAAGAGVNVTIGTGRALVREPEPAPPASLRGVRIVGIDYRGGTVGAISERRGRRLTAVLVSRAPGFALADESEQQQRLAVWASVLGAAGHGAVRRIAWVQRSAPAQTDGLARWLHEQRDPDIPFHGNRIADSYLDLLEHSTQAVQENEVLLAIQVDQSRMRRDDRGQLERALVSACEQVAAGLERARVHTDRALTRAGSRGRCALPMTPTSAVSSRPCAPPDASMSSQNLTPGPAERGRAGRRTGPTGHGMSRSRSPGGPAPRSARRSSPLSWPAQNTSVQSPCRLNL